MSRKDFGAKPLSYPQPVWIIATYDENGVPNAMNAAWGGISESNELSVCLECKVKPITFDPFNNAYHVIGEKVGDAWGSGKSLM